ncbi:LOG family protein ORF6 in fasciation locus [Caulifigura coniformis]|uniref:Cytokinin riboside 5'-monophosphate phosphoribohydrolase n=1 Tax=Caulifigura coniformis TaxID=2527983 RepID=A0A517SFU0_9PLAN|nr:TIGR00730 family Rossman fold protein [Caulifigura coniformis]QDT54996.1 LOG family protein ORF6 in fasciation locus [Caulifigura coniformis]
MTSLCVFCGSRHGKNPAFTAAANALGQEITRRNWRLVYGGGNVGLMGVVADAVLEAGGQVIGVIPDHLMAKELGHGGCTELRVVQSMHERKALMAAESSMFLAIPGGLGTLEELAEIWTWQQLALHNKPIGLLNSENFYDPLLEFLDNAVTEEFIRPVHRRKLIVGESIPELLDRLAGECVVDQPIPLEKT